LSAQRCLEAARRTWLRAGAIALGTVAVLMLAPASAGAHAYVVRTDPPAGALVKTAPHRVTVVWDEAITFGIGGPRAALGVYAPDGKRVDSGNVQHPVGDTLTVALPHHLKDGTYTVGWKVTSADTHVVSGAFTFSVGTRTGGAGVAQKLESSQQIPLPLRDGFAVVRFLNLLLLLLCAGGAASLVFVQRDAAPAVRRRLWSIIVVCAIALAVVAVLGLPFEAAEQDGTGLLKGLQAKAIAGVRGTRFGEIWLARAWLATIIAALAFSFERWSPARRAREILLLGAAAALALTPTASGHADVDGTLTFLVDALHVLSAAAWGGGLAFLAAGLALTASGDRWPLAARTVPRFSALALGSVAVLLAAGGANAYLEVRAFRGFVDSTYGALVLVKIGLALPLLALGAFNNRVSVPRLRAGLGSVTAHRQFARAIGAELLVFVAIVGVTAVLIDEAPAKDVPVHPPGPVTAQTTVGPFTATLRIAPATAGANTIDVRVVNSRGRAAKIAAVTVAATLPSHSLGPLNYAAKALGGGRYRVSDAKLAIAGSWQIQLAVRQGQFNEWLRTVSVSIGN
jgi:copper transport protein